MHEDTIRIRAVCCHVRFVSSFHGLETGGSRCIVRFSFSFEPDVRMYDTRRHVHMDRIHALVHTLLKYNSKDHDVFCVMKMRAAMNACSSLLRILYSTVGMVYVRLLSEKKKLCRGRLARSVIELPTTIIQFQREQFTNFCGKITCGAGTICSICSVTARSNRSSSRTRDRTRVRHYGEGSPLSSSRAKARALHTGGRGFSGLHRNQIWLAFAECSQTIMSCFTAGR